MSVKQFIQALQQKKNLWLQTLTAKAWFRKIPAFVRTSWRSMIWGIPAVIALYYGIGGWATNKIDKDTNFDIQAPRQGYASVEIAAKLIRREVNEHLWTPSLPMIFPGYALDNMPAFQTGLIKTLHACVKTLSRVFNSPELKEAADYLGYPHNVWLLSKTDNLAMAPSSGAQYRKAGKILHRFNKNPSEAAYAPDVVFSAMVKTLRDQLNNALQRIEVQVRENSATWIDPLADDVFYETQGKMFAAYAMLKAMAADYSPMLVERGLYEPYTAIQKTLADGLRLDPLVVRNGEAASLTAPNHLLELGYYVGKAISQLSIFELRLSAQRI